MKSEFSNAKWVDLEEFKGYQINHLGKIRNRASNRVSNGSINPSGYRIARFYFIDDEGKKKAKDYRIDWLVSKYFLEEPQNKKEYELIHIDNNLSNSCHTNLKWELKSTKKSKGKPVCEYNLEGKHIRTWLSASEVAKVYNISSRTIHDACVKRTKSAYGRQWRYLESTNEKAISKISLRPYDLIKLQQKIKYHVYDHSVIVSPDHIYTPPTKHTHLEQLDSLIKTSSLSNDQKNSLREIRKYVQDLENILLKHPIKDLSLLSEEEMNLINTLKTRQ